MIPIIMQGKWENKREDALFSKFPAKLVGFWDRRLRRENFFGFFQNYLTFFKFPRVISGKIIFSAKVPSKCPLKLAISEGIFHFCEKNLQKGVGKYRFPGFIGRGTIILKILPQRCPLLPVSVQSM